MLYLSRLILNPRSRQVRAELMNPYEMHRTLLQGVGASREVAGLLFRVDVARETGTPTVLVQSATEPSWEALAEHEGYLLPGLPANPAVKPFAPCFSEGQMLQFRLRANPTARRNGKRVGHYSEEAQQEWLTRKLAAAGCDLVVCQIASESLIEATKHEAGQRVRMPLLAVRFDGVLRVRRTALLPEVLAAGLGSAKAFGFGLLSLAPVS